MEYPLIVKPPTRRLLAGGYAHFKLHGITAWPWRRYRITHAFNADNFTHYLFGRGRPMALPLRGRALGASEKDTNDIGHW